jgi:hypothetical protein
MPGKSENNACEYEALWNAIMNKRNANNLFLIDLDLIRNIITGDI